MKRKDAKMTKEREERRGGEVAGGILAWRIFADLCVFAL